MKRVILLAVLACCAISLPAQERREVRTVESKPSKDTSPDRPKPPPGMPGYAPSAKAYISAAVNDVDKLFRARDTAAPVIVQFGQSNEKEQAEMEEDLTVMSHLLDKSLGKAYPTDGHTVKMGIPMFFSGGRSARAQYIEGFGALFLLKVGFPLSGENVEVPDKDKEKASSDWERARREVYGIREPKQEELLEFNADTVATLKSELLDALKQAKNIRHLKEDDVVALTVFGTAPKAKEGKEAQKGTVLTLKISKREVLEATKENLTTEAFAKTVTTHTYRGHGSDSGGTFLHKLRPF